MTNADSTSEKHVPVVLPDLRVGGEPVRVSCWLVDVGDNVALGDRLVEVLIRGATFDVSAPADGILVAIEKTVDAPVSTGEQLGLLQAVADLV